MRRTIKASILQAKFSENAVGVVCLECLGAGCGIGLFCMDLSVAIITPIVLWASFCFIPVSAIPLTIFFTIVWMALAGLVFSLISPVCAGVVALAAGACSLGVHSGAIDWREAMTTTDERGG